VWLGVARCRAVVARKSPQLWAFLRYSQALYGPGVEITTSDQSAATIFNAVNGVRCPRGYGCAARSA
jgi:hypothetical protein